tara:strand:- start:4175 stop:4456 length:282 start_codon:yes stop_codon:yes gene_type:complete
MADVFIYTLFAIAGYALGSVMGWVAGVNNLKIKKLSSLRKENMCEDYSHLRNSPAARKSLYERSIKSVERKDLYEKVYDADIIDDEYKVNKVI